MAFLAPCAVALLPGYILAYVSRDVVGTPAISLKLARGLKLATFSILGILLVYSFAGVLIVAASQVLKEYMKYITIGMGGVLIIIGTLMLLGKNMAFTFNIKEPSTQSETKEAFFFGLAYAVGALGCLFPLFLVVATQAMAAPNLLKGGSYILAYFVGISAMMILMILLATFARNFLIKHLRKILPQMERITGIVLIFAGVYVINYQMALFA